MSRVKNVWVAMALVLTIITGSTAKTDASGIPVIDTANLVQSVLQAIAWIQQFQQMQQQILQADQQIHAIMGSRNMGSLLNNLTLAGVVPSDVNAVYHAIRSGGVQGLTAAAQIIRNNRMIYNCQGKTGDALRICQNMLNQTPQSQAYYANTYQMLMGRMQQIRALTTRINQTEDAKEILELNGRIAAEQAQVSNDTNRIMTMKSMIEAEEKAAQQEHQERVLKMLAPGTVRTFDHIAPWTP
ncbi:MAG: type IV secretion system protein [Nitrospira sp.]|nr:type IV secretion system protein [Nitrospira sp.]MDH4354830.1 type IV secretion system protein [Nitrospira sp.]MDH5317096.1 type IV secretion system protein [Nitrospira sp.]